MGIKFEGKNYSKGAATLNNFGKSDYFKATKLEAGKSINNKYKFLKNDLSTNLHYDNAINFIKYSK